MPTKENLPVSPLDRHGNRRRTDRWVPWPTPSEVKMHPNHLELGITVGAALDVLEATGWPQDYERSAEDVERIGPLVRGREVGDDLVAHLRKFKVEKGYTEFSIAEVLLATEHTGVGPAMAYLSHAKAELVEDTINLAEAVRRDVMYVGDASHKTTFIDYFCCRQCSHDFKELESVKAAIRQIGQFFSGFSIVPNGSVGALCDVNCLFEIYFTIEQQIPWSVMPSRADSTSLAQIVAYYPNGFDLRCCQTALPEEQAKLLMYVECSMGIDCYNKMVTRSLMEMAKKQKRCCTIS